jgi:hypothetical protein
MREYDKVLQQRSILANTGIQGYLSAEAARATTGGTAQETNKKKRATDYLVDISKDTTKYEKAATISAGDITKLRDYVAQCIKLRSCFQVLKAEVVGTDVRVKSLDDGAPSFWAWSDEETRADIKELCGKAYTSLLTYGFVVAAFPIDSLAAMRNHVAGAASYAFDKPMEFRANARVRLAATDNRPLAESAQMKHAWVCGAKLIDPADLGCNFDIYQSHTEQPRVYARPCFESIKQTDHVKHLLKNYRIVTYSTTQDIWFSGDALCTPVAALEPDEKQLRIREALDILAMSRRSIGAVIVEMEAREKPLATTTQLDHLMSDAVPVASPGHVPPIHIPLGDDAGAYHVPVSTANWNITTDHRLATKTRLLDSPDLMSPPRQSTFDAMTLADAVALKRRMINVATTAQEGVMDATVKLPPHIRKSEYVSPEHHASLTAEFESNYHNKMLNLLRLRENTFGASIVSNASAGSAHAVTGAQTTTKRTGSIINGGTAPSGVDVSLHSAVSHPSVVYSAQDDLRAFFVFFVSESLYPLEHIHIDYIRKAYKNLTEAQELDIRLDNAVDIIGKEITDTGAKEYITLLHKNMRDKDEGSRLIRKNLEFIRGVISTVEHAAGMHERIRLEFNTPTSKIEEAAKEAERVRVKLANREDRNAEYDIAIKKAGLPPGTKASYESSDESDSDSGDDDNRDDSETESESEDRRRRQRQRERARKEKAASKKRKRAKRDAPKSNKRSKRKESGRDTNDNADD